MTMSTRIVLVDDAPFIRDVLRHVLNNEADFEIVGEAGDGDQAIALALETKPDVILMDIVMPKKSGIEATAEILKTLPECRIIACSTVEQETMVLRAVEAGCCSYVVKPFKGQDVIKAVRSAAAQIKGATK